MSPASSKRRLRTTDEGQAAIEVALALPLVVVTVLAVVQIAVILGDVLVVQLAAREAARAASVAAAPSPAADHAAQRVLAGRGTVSTSSADGMVRVTVTRVNHTDVPLVGALLPDVTVDASVSMAFEPPATLRRTPPPGYRRRRCCSAAGRRSMTDGPRSSSTANWTCRRCRSSPITLPGPSSAIPA